MSQHPYQVFEAAIEAAENAKREILRIDPSSSERPLLDESFAALTQAIEFLSKLLEPVG